MAQNNEERYREVQVENKCYILRRVGIIRVATCPEVCVHVPGSRAVPCSHLAEMIMLNTDCYKSDDMWSTSKLCVYYTHDTEWGRYEYAH